MNHFYWLSLFGFILLAYSVFVGNKIEDYKLIARQLEGFKQTVYIKSLPWICRFDTEKHIKWFNSIEEGQGKEFVRKWLDGKFDHY